MEENLVRGIKGRLLGRDGGENQLYQIHIDRRGSEVRTRALVPGSCDVGDRSLLPSPCPRIRSKRVTFGCSGSTSKLN